MAQRNLLLLSNSTLHPTGYLEYAKETIIKFLKEKQVEKVNSKSQPSSDKHPVSVDFFYFDLLISL